MKKAKEDTEQTAAWAASGLERGGAASRRAMESRRSGVGDRGRGQGRLPELRFGREADDGDVHWDGKRLQKNITVYFNFKWLQWKR